MDEITNYYEQALKLFSNKGCFAFNQASDWLRDKGLDLEADWLAASEFIPNAGYGDGYGGGYGGGGGYKKSKPNHKHKDQTMPAENEYVCVRSRDQGVVWGFYQWGSGRTAKINEARQQRRWEENAMTLFELVQTDPKKTKIQLSDPVEWIEMTEICGFIKIPDNMVEKFRKLKSYKG